MAKDSVSLFLSDSTNDYDLAIEAEAQSEAERQWAARGLLVRGRADHGSDKADLWLHLVGHRGTPEGRCGAPGAR
jgi:hypothetical protein